MHVICLPVNGKLWLGVKRKRLTTRELIKFDVAFSVQYYTYFASGLCCQENVITFTSKSQISLNNTCGRNVPQKKRQNYLFQFVSQSCHNKTKVTLPNKRKYWMKLEDEKRKQKRRKRPTKTTTAIVVMQGKLE